jgi:hypothetical protein
MKLKAGKEAKNEYKRFREAIHGNRTKSQRQRQQDQVSKTKAAGPGLEIECSRTRYQRKQQVQVSKTKAADPGLENKGQFHTQVNGEKGTCQLCKALLYSTSCRWPPLEWPVGQPKTVSCRKILGFKF